MTWSYTYTNPVKTLFGRGTLGEINALLSGRRAVLIATPSMKRLGVTEKIRELCGKLLVHTSTDVATNPSISAIETAYEGVKGCSFDVVIGIGGGSALDTAKAVALLSGGPLRAGWLKAHLTRGEALDAGHAPKPVIAIPTTAGTGSEVTKWATIWGEGNFKKYSLAHDRLYAECALYDPELTDSLPYEPSLFGALDTLSHSMEALWNRNANPVSDVLATAAIGLSAATLKEGYRDIFKDPEMRERLLKATLLSGLAFSNTQTALAHSISYPMSARLKMPHGLACGFTLAEILKFNHAHDHARTGLAIRALGSETIDEAVKRLYGIFRTAGVSGYLASYDVFGLIDSGAEFVAAARAGNNICSISNEDAIKILQTAYSTLTKS